MLRIERHLATPCVERGTLRKPFPERAARDPPPLRVHVDGDQLDLDLIRKDVGLPYAISLFDLETIFSDRKVSVNTRIRLHGKISTTNTMQH